MASRRIYELTSIYSTGFTIDSSTEIAIDRGDYTEAYKMNLNELISYSSGGTSGTSGSSGVDGVSGTDGTSGIDGESFTGATTAPSFYYENDILYTPKLNVSNSGTTSVTLHDVVDGSAYNLYISGGTLTISVV